MLIVRLLMAVLAGIAGHRFYTPSQMFGPRWGSMLRYAIGLLLFIPCLTMVKQSINETNEIERDLMAGLLTAGALGTGTFVGHLFDGLSDK